MAGEVGFCGETGALRVAAAVLHFGEEPPLVGDKGSGTIFISGCNLGCAFCQNYQISQRERGSASLGREVTAEEFAGICISLRDKGAANINIVTGSHAVPGIVEGLAAAKSAGVEIPVLWNSSGYESLHALELLKDHVDTYLPDLKTLDGEIAAKFFNAPDYPETAAKAILKMIEMAHNKPHFCKSENAQDKVIIRHLILPGYLDNTRSVLRWFADNAKNDAMLSLMTQYTPLTTSKWSGIPQNYLSEEEYKTVLSYLEEFKIEEGFFQELVTGSIIAGNGIARNEWLPDFRRPNPFSAKLSLPVWSSQGDASQSDVSQSGVPQSGVSQGGITSQI